MNEEQKRNIIYILLGLLLLLMIATAVIFYKPTEPYTTLYFTEPSQIKTKISVDEPFYVNFTVENHEKELCKYSYSLELIYYDNQTILKTTNISRGNIALNNNETSNISEKIVIRDPSSNQTKVSVELFKEGVDGTYRNLWYWIEVRH